MISALQTKWFVFSTYINIILCTCNSFFGLLACLPDNETAIDYGKCMLLSMYLYGHSWDIFVEDGEERKLEEEL